MKPLLVHVDDIHNAAQPWEAELSRQDLDEMLLGDKPTEFHAGGPAKVHAKLTRMGKKVLVQAAFQVPLTGSCKRCLKDVALAEDVELTLTFQPVAGVRASTAKRNDDSAAAQAEKRHQSRRERDDSGPPTGSFELEMADEETYSGQSIDLAPAVREQVILAAPSSPLCAEECKGLCAVCGNDKNLRDCGCAEVNIDPRWEALKAVRLSPTTDVKSYKE